MVKRKKTKVAILFGGKSVEHDISFQSAKNIYKAVDKEKYDIVLIGIDKKGRWFLQDKAIFNLGAVEKVRITGDVVEFTPGGNGELFNISNPEIKEVIDIVFPVLHGTFGEDGTIQGILKSAEVAFVGASITGSVVGIDKEITKRILRDSGISVGNFMVFRNYEKIVYEDIVYKLGLPLFVKPATLGSSVGISKVPDKSTLAILEKAIVNAFKYDRKILVEEYIEGREIECSVLGNNIPKASVLGEVIPDDEFYSYEAKYVKKEGAQLKIPADISEEKTKEIQKLAIQVFKTLSCEGLARIDFFLKKDGEVIVNEINTIPGFTSISMYPKLWEESGIGYTELIEKLLQLAQERFYEENKIQYLLNT